MNRLKNLLLSSTLFLLLFSLDGIDVSTLISLNLLPFVNFKKVVLKSRNLVILFLVFFLTFSLASIPLSFTITNLSLYIRFTGLYVFSVFMITYADTITNEFEKILRIIILGAVFFDIISLVLVFYFNIYFLEGFKPFYPSFRFQGFYNLTINAIVHAILLFYLTSLRLFSRKITFFLFLILATSLLLSLTRTAYALFLCSVIVYSLLNLGFFKRILKFVFLMIIIFLVFGNQLSRLEFSSVRLTELLSSRIVNDTYNAQDNLESKRGNFYYPKQLISNMNVKLLGNGLGSAEIYGGKIFDIDNSPIGGDAKLGTHNTFVHILLDYGLLAFITFILSIVLLIVQTVYSIFKYNNSLLKINLSILVGMLFAFMYQDLDFYLPFVMFFVLIIIMSDKLAIKLIF